MKAAQIKEYGDASKVEVVEVARPEPIADQVLVQVRAASLNPFDTMVRQGYVQQMMPLDLPVTLGGDIAGTVVAVGANVEGFAVGEAVYGQANAVAGNSGALAEFAATAASQIAKAPSTISLEDAAALPLVGVSAQQALTEHIKLQSGQKILITGGAGGIGRVAIQIAKHLGAHVATTATGEGLEMARRLGADEVIDYKQDDYTKQLRDFDAAFDTVGGDELQRVVSILKEGGTAVSMAGEPATRAGITSIAQRTITTTAKLDALRELVEAGVVQPGVGKVYDLDNIQAAFEARESGAVNGKIVIRIGE